MEAPAWLTVSILVAAFIALAAALVLRFWRLDPLRAPRGSAIGMYASFFVGFATYLIVIVLAVSSHQGEPEEFAPPIWLHSAATLTALVGMIVSLYWTDPRPMAYLGLTPPKMLRGLSIGSALFLLAWPLALATGIFTMMMVELLGGKPPQEHEVLRQLLSPDTPTSTIVVLIIGATVVAPLVEEFMFRGLLQRLFIRLPMRRKYLPPYASAATGIVLSSVLFVIIHGEPAYFPALMVLSLVLGIAYQRTRNLWVCIVLHAWFNAAQIALTLWLHSQQ